MDVTALLSEDTPSKTALSFYQSFSTTPYQSAQSTMTPKSLSPSTDPKTVHFKLCDGATSSEPRTLHINPHDTTDSITSTVKNMFGVSTLDDSGLSFKDELGRYLIPRHENFNDGMTVFIRIEETLQQALRSAQVPYGLRQSQQQHSGYQFAFRSSAASAAYSAGRSVSPTAARGRRSGSATAGNTNMSRSRSMKRQNTNGDMFPTEQQFQDYLQNPESHYQPSQQFLPHDDAEMDYRNSREPLASAEISTDNIVEGSRRKRAKFSSDSSPDIQELPLFPPPALPRHSGSTASSISPSHATPQVTTPYAHRYYSYSQPTPPSNYNGYGAGMPSSNIYSQPNEYRNGIIPTPAPTIASCISDEDVALQLMRLGEPTTYSATASTLDDNADEPDPFSSDGGEYGDDGRSDTTELPELPPPGDIGENELLSSPILYPRTNGNYKSLDEILPSFDSTVPSDDENQSSLEQAFLLLPQIVGTTTEDEYEEGEAVDDEGDETYVGKEEDDDADYDEDLDDIPLKTLRGRKQSASVTPAPITKPINQLSHPRGVVKATKRKQPTTLQTKPLKNQKSQLPPSHYPISPASPPASRKPSIASSSVGGKSRSNTLTNITMPPSGSVFNQQTATPIEEHHHHHHHLEQLEEPLPKPRCQRCRKSKKGCDRQRPCQRCKDAGIPADQCISEDEAGTRRGRQAAAAARKASTSSGVGKAKGKGKRKRV